MDPLLGHFQGQNFGPNLEKYFLILEDGNAEPYWKVDLRPLVS